MTSLDHWDAEVQNRFTTMKKSTDDTQKAQIAQNLAVMYEKRGEYSDAIFNRICKLISESNDKQDKKVGLIVLAKVGVKMQGISRSYFVNKFHSPIFKLFENNQDQFLLPYMEQAYEIILEIGGNRNDSVIQNNLNITFSNLLKNSKDVKKIGGYSILRILVISSPYITFKKIQMKEKSNQVDNLSTLIEIGKSRNFKVRKAYLSFLNEFIQYISEKKDRIYQLNTLEKIRGVFHNLLPTDTNEQNNHLYLQTMSIFLIHMKKHLSEQVEMDIEEFTVKKMDINKNPIIQKSLLKIISLISTRETGKNYERSINWLKQIKGDDQVQAHQTINIMLQTINIQDKSKQNLAKNMLQEIQKNFGQNLQTFSKTHGSINKDLFAEQVRAEQVRTVLILLKKLKQINIEENIFANIKLQELVTNGLIIRLHKPTLNLLKEVCAHEKQKKSGLDNILEKKLILILSKILTGSLKKVLRDKSKLENCKQFIQFLKKNEPKDTLQCKVMAIETLSNYKFQHDQHRKEVGQFVLYYIITSYLQHTNAQIRIASVQAAFSLHAKKNKLTGTVQLMEVRAKLLRVGVNDQNQKVRVKVFGSILHSLQKHQQCQQFYTSPILLSLLFHSIEDSNKQIRLLVLRILCVLHDKNPSVMIIPFLKKITFNCFHHFSTSFYRHHDKKSLIQTITVLIHKAPSIVQNHVDALLLLLLKFLQDQQSYEGLQLVFFNMFTVIAQQLPYCMVPHVQEVSKYLLQTMQDKINTKKKSKAMKTFLAIIKHCGYVVIPYFQLQGLHDTLVYMMQSQIGTDTQNDLLRILGGLGAVDMHKFTSISGGIYNNSRQFTKIRQSSVFHHKQQSLTRRIKDNYHHEQLKIYYDQLLILQGVHSNQFRAKDQPSIALKEYQQKKNRISDTTIKKRQPILFEKNHNLNFNLVVLYNLFEIIFNNSLSQKHELTLNIMQAILCRMEMNLEHEIKLVIPILLQLCEYELQGTKLLIILIERYDLSIYIDQVMKYVLKCCIPDERIVELFQVITNKLHHVITHYLQAIIEKLYPIVSHELNHNYNNLMIKIIQIYTNVQSLIEPYLSLVIPQLLGKFFQKSSEVTNSAIDFFMSIAKNGCEFSQYIPLILNQFCILLKSCHQKHIDCKPCLRKKIGNCTVLFVIIFSQSFVPHLPLIHRALIACQEEHQLYNKIIQKLQYCYSGGIKRCFKQEEIEKLFQCDSINTTKRTIPKEIKNLSNIEQLIHEFDLKNKKFTDADWIEWLKKTSVLLLKKSPSNILKICSDLAQQYNQLALQFYNISFYVLWEQLPDNHKKNLIDHLKIIINFQPKPFFLIRKVILNLVQFMNRKKCYFQINSNLLANFAKQASSFAKHLYYRQIQFEINPQRTLDSLIEVFMKLGEPENAFGLVQLAFSMNLNCKTEWYEKMAHYEQAYEKYEKIQQIQPLVKMSKLKCLSYLDDERFLYQFNNYNNPQKFTNHHLMMLTARSYARLQQWQKVGECCESDAMIQDGQFFGALVNIKKDKYNEAIIKIKKARKIIYEETTQLMSLASSTESFEKILRLQQLFQMQEIIKISKMKERMKIDEEQNQVQKNKQKYTNNLQNLKQVWKDRLLGCPRKENVWNNIAFVRSLLFNKAEYFEFFYEYCEICIEDNQTIKCQRIIQTIEKQSSQQQQKYNWPLLELLRIKINFARQLIHTPEQINMIVNFLNAHKQHNPIKFGQAYYKCSQLLYENTDNSTSYQNRVIELAEEATKLHQAQKHWYFLGLMHLKAANFESEQLTLQIKQNHIIFAVEAFLKSLETKTYDGQFFFQGCLKILSVLFNYSHIQKVYDKFMSHYQKIPLQGWIEVVPQIIAQLYENDDKNNSNCKNFLNILKLLLTELGRRHPQSVLFSLNFAAKSKIAERVKPAEQILQLLKQIHPILTSEGETISKQLNRAAIKLGEQWYDGIESAWSIYQQNNNPNHVVVLLKNLCHEVMERKNSNSQIAFHQQYGQQIKQGYCWLLHFEKSRDLVSLSQAYEIFYQIYKKIKQSFQYQKKVFLKNVAPALVTRKKYQSSMPGLYTPGKTGVKIQGFANELNILQSKQRPRKLTIYGTDGKEYNFLLKGREDLRLDQRVMQFFALVNKLLSLEKETCKKDLNIIRYSIIPLSINTGLIGWVQNCDTLNQLIKQYRNSNKIRMYVEKQLYQKMCNQYVNLPMMNKIQLFRYAADCTQGKDLMKILWLKSASCQAWVERRVNYTKSLATMSMVGYIIGLGDRHPSNIMVQRQTGKIVHIDFGDCFEVAMLRQKFPQMIPFRLTRMLQKVMGVAGIQGMYRQTCKAVMRVLRNNKESLLAVLETFVHDPIISWKIALQQKEQISSKQKIDNSFMLQSLNDKKSEVFIGSIMKGLQQIKMNEQKDKDVQQLSLVRKRHQYKDHHYKINEKAKKALLRIKYKFKGTEFDKKTVCTVDEQINKLIAAATSVEKICQSWPGWCPFW